jgi:NAD(P)H-dependent flavin oxidoreductase YrpB (nitropropane dioxygenase family)
MRTRITSLLGIRYPIIQAPANYVGVPQLVAAVSNAGGLGILASGRLAPEDLRQDIRVVKELTSKPFGVNLIAGSPGYEKLAAVFLEENIPVICHSRGNPKWLIEAARGRSVKVMAMIGTLKHALRAEQDGADAVIVQGAEAGGHVGQVSTLVLLPLVASKVKIPVVGAGGFADGKGLVAALALGAEAVAMGTRFALTVESPLPPNVKQRYLETSENDTLVTDAVTGTRLRVIRNRFTDMLEEGRQVGLRDRIAAASRTRKVLGVSWWRFLRGGWSMRKEFEASVSDLGHLAAGGVRIERAMVSGDVDLGVLPSGQVCGRLEDIPCVGDLMESIVAEAQAVLDDVKIKVVG